MTTADRADTLKTAFRICNVGPLEGEDIGRYYVDLSAVRKTEAIEGVNTILDFQEPAQFTTALFTGHRGCGKSTELKRIQTRWQQDFRVIYLEVNEETDINDAEYGTGSLRGDTELKALLYKVFTGLASKTRKYRLCKGLRCFITR